MYCSPHAGWQNRGIMEAGLHSRKRQGLKEQVLSVRRIRSLVALLFVTPKSRVDIEPINGWTYIDDLTGDISIRRRFIRLHKPD